MANALILPCGLVGSLSTFVHPAAAAAAAFAAATAARAVNNRERFPDENEARKIKRKEHNRSVRVSLSLMK